MPTPRAPSPRDLSRTVLLMALMGWGVGLVLTMLAFGLNQGNERAQAMLSTRSWVALWSVPLNELPVTSVADCGQGPVPSCAVVVAPMPEGGDALVRTWPQQNWAKAWLPLSAWRVAHGAASHAADSAYGQRVLDAGPEGVSRVTDPNGLRRTNPTPSWRLSMIVAPTASDRGTGPLPSPASTPAFTPTVSHRPYGPVVRFDDGMELPARQEDGRWYVLAQGPMNQAQRMAAALMGRADPGVSEAPVPVVPAQPLAPAHPTSPASGPSSVPTPLPDPDAAMMPSLTDPSSSGSTDRPDRRSNRADDERNGERTARPDLRTPGAALPASAASGTDHATPDRDERSRDREVLRHLPEGRRPMLDSVP